MTEGESESCRTEPDDERLGEFVGFSLCDADGDDDGDVVSVFETSGDLDEDGQTEDVRDLSVVRVPDDDKDDFVERVAHAVVDPERVESIEAVKRLDFELLGDTDKLAVLLCVSDTKGEKDAEPEEDTLGQSETLAD